MTEVSIFKIMMITSGRFKCLSCIRKKSYDKRTEQVVDNNILTYNEYKIERIK